MSGWRRWMGRFSFSFLIVAVALGWESYRGVQRGASTARVAIMIIAGFVLFVLFLFAIRLRHAPDEP
jgi:hypothetical protein